MINYIIYKSSDNITLKWRVKIQNAFLRGLELFGGVLLALLDYEDSLL